MTTTSTIIISLIAGTITALAVQLFIGRIVSRIERLETRLSERSHTEWLRMQDLSRGLAEDWRQRAGNGIWQRVTRLDVIRPLPDGRSSETTDGVEWALQDDGRTLKIWTDGRWRDRQEGNP